MKGRERHDRHVSIRHWLNFECAVVVIASVMTFAMLDFVSNVLIRQTEYNPIVAVGMVVPMAFVTGVVSYYFNRRFNRYVEGLVDGLRSVAEGDFSTQLDIELGNPLGDAYADFNKMSRELNGVQTLREDFINNFSHEFKTPITAIAGFVELVQEPDISEEDRREYLGIISEEAERLARLSQSTLLLSKLETQQTIPERADFSLDEQVKRCAILLSPQWEAKCIEFSADVQEGVTYHGSEELMRHVWINLIGNAIRYTPDGGEVAVRMRSDGREITVSVADTGEGMAEDVLARVFDKYYQGDASHTGKGLGLGLAISHRIVELCGGEIHVESSPGQGSTFTVTLPIRQG